MVPRCSRLVSGFDDSRDHSSQLRPHERSTECAAHLEAPHGPYAPPTAAPRACKTAEHTRRGLLQAAQNAAAGEWGAYEICVRNADKGAILRRDLDARLAAFAARGLTVLLSDATLFPDKAARFPGCRFALGYDTAVRLLDPKYYGNSEARMVDALRRVAQHGCAFIVAGRSSGAEFRTLDDVAMPHDVRGLSLFAGVPAAQFREDVSSTELRQRMAAAAQ